MDELLGTHKLQRPENLQITASTWPEPRIMNIAWWHGFSRLTGHWPAHARFAASIRKVGERTARGTVAGSPRVGGVSNPTGLQRSCAARQERKSYTRAMLANQPPGLAVGYRSRPPSGVSAQTVLTAADGLSNSFSVAVWGHTSGCLTRHTSPTKIPVPCGPASAELPIRRDEHYWVTLP
jgi:hypothetical protein